MKLLANSTNIINYIPQRPPFVMVSELLASNEKKATSSFIIKQENILVENETFSVSGLLENIAQTAAAQVGYACYLKKIPVPVGFIGAISKVKVTSLPAVNSIIKTSIEVKHEVFGITLIVGEVRLNGELMISCQMKIMLDKSIAE